MILTTAAFTTIGELNAPKDGLIAFGGFHAPVELFVPLETTHSNGLIRFEINQLRSQLKTFSCLEHNWDSFGADPISLSAISIADELLSACEAHQIIPNRIDPTGEDSVMIENHRSGRKLVFEVFGTGEIAVLLKSGAEREAKMASLEDAIVLIANFA